MVEPGRGLLQIALVQHRLPERPEQRGDGSHGGQSVPLYVTHHGPDSERSAAYVEEVAPDQRLALRGPVQPRAADRPDAVGQRGQNGELSGLGHRPHGDQMRVPAAADQGHEHAEHGDEGDGEQVRVARMVELQGGNVQQEYDDRAEGGRREGPVGEDGQGGDGAQQKTDVQRVAARELTDADPQQQDRRQEPYPPRRGRAAQPSPAVVPLTGRGLRGHGTPPSAPTLLHSAPPRIPVCPARSPATTGMR